MLTGAGNMTVPRSQMQTLTMCFTAALASVLIGCAESQPDSAEYYADSEYDAAAETVADAAEDAATDYDAMAPTDSGNSATMQDEIRRLEAENARLRGQAPAMQVPVQRRYRLIGNFGNDLGIYDDHDSCLDRAYSYQRSLDEDCTDPEGSEVMKALACERRFTCEPI